MSSRRRDSPRWVSRTWEYSVLGALVALGAPLGLLFLRCVVEDAWPWSAWVPSWTEWLRYEISSHRLVYSYLLLSTPIMLAVLGYLVGRTQERLESQALSDLLTGLPNRTYYETRLASELARAARYQEPFALLLVDLDNLKQINDSGGHRTGDAALQAVADALRNTIRETDFAARLGGDEFVVLAPSTQGAEAMELARRVRATLAEGRAGATVSIGVADVAPTARVSADKLLRSADEALYAAKRGGRDREELASRTRKESGTYELGSGPTPAPSAKLAG